MEFVGRTVTKEFKGFGVFTGIVKSYDSSSGFFEIAYKDGDSEEIDLSELSALLEVDAVATNLSPSLSAKKPSRVGRRPKKRRRVLGALNSGNENDLSDSVGDALTNNGSNLNSVVEGDLKGEVIIVDNLSKNLAFSVNNNNNVNSSYDNVNSNDGGLDLNRGVHDLAGNNGKGNEDEIDLNLDLNEENNLELKGKDLEDSVKKELCFDLNMDLDDNENKNQDVDLGGYMNGETSGGKFKETQLKDAKSNASNLEVSGDVGAESPEDLGNNDSSGNQINNIAVDGVSPVIDSHGNSGQTYPGKRRGRKRRKLLDTPNTVNETGLTETGLRRSARMRAKFSAEEHEPTVLKYDSVDIALPSSVTSPVSEDQLMISECEESEEPTILPQKLELPPSTGNLNLDGLPVLDLFSIYAFLRSFSTLLYLSPFELEDFVACIRSTSPSLLIDSIHVSLLRTLRKHLEFQSSENSKAATNCLRDLNWDLLDAITWPIFMVEYLLTKPDFDLTHLKLFKTDYYKQPDVVKVEMLQYLCDDVIEVEVISSDLTRRALASEFMNIVDTDQNATLVFSKKRKATVAISGSSCMSEEVVDETADWNSDECCLCKMDGNLICCDGCPAAYHSKCVGISTNLLPEGDWFCPECVVDKKNPGINVAKAIRGAELLGVDPHGRSYYDSCGYLLVSDVSDGETSFHYYHMNDLTALINSLNILNGPYRAISNAIAKNSRLYKNLCGKVETFAEEKLPLAPSTGSSEISEAANSPKTGLNSSNSNPKSSGDPSSTPSKMNVERRKNVDSSNHGNDSKTATRKGMPQKIESGYLNLYTFARVASLVAGEWFRKFPDKTSQPTKTLEELISVQMKAISKTSGDFCWSNIRNLSVDARKEKCGWCLACKFPTDDGDCLFFMNNAAVMESFTSDILGFGSIIDRKDRLVDVMCHIICIEDRLHGLLLGPWLNPHFSKLYRKSFVEASDIVPVKRLLLMLESNIRLRALSDEWLKHVDSVSAVGSASLIVISKNRMPSRNVIGRKRSLPSGSEPHSSKNASSGLGLFWWRGGRLTRQLYNCKGLPRSLASKAARKGGGKKIDDGIFYPENADFPKRNKALAWRAAVESAVTVEQLALQVRELDANIKWEEIENTSHLAKLDKESIKSMRSFKKAIVRRKSSEGTAVKYLLDFGKRRFIPDTVVKHGSKVEDSLNGRKKYWVEESFVPLFLLKGFEDRRIAFKSSKMSPGKLSVIKRAVKPSKNACFSYLFSKAEKAEYHQCGHCDKDVPIGNAVSCEYCEGFFHKRHARKISGGATADCTYSCNKCHAAETVKVSPNKGKSQSWRTKKASKSGKPSKSKKAGKGKKAGQQAKGKSIVVPLRRSARTAKIVSLQSKKKPLKKKKKPKPSSKKKQQLKSIDKKIELDFVYEVKQTNRKRGRPRKVRRDIYQKKRSQSHSSYWLNGLFLSRKPNDERAKDFQSRNHIGSFEKLDSISDHQPKCGLCHEAEFRSSLTYFSCDTCKEWFHGDAFGLKVEYFGRVIGFKCHNCRKRVPPVCPHLNLVTDESNLDQQQIDAENGRVLGSSTDTRRVGGDDYTDASVKESSLSYKGDPAQNGIESGIMESRMADVMDLGPTSELNQEKSFFEKESSLPENVTNMEAKESDADCRGELVDKV